MSESSRPSTPEPFTPEGVAKTINERAGFELHAWQAEAVALLKNDKDVLLTAAPGAGKSIVYLGAALLMSERHVAVIVFHPEEAGHRAQVSLQLGGRRPWLGSVYATLLRLADLIVIFLIPGRESAQARSPSSLLRRRSLILAFRRPRRLGSRLLRDRRLARDDLNLHLPRATYQQSHVACTAYGRGARWLYVGLIRGA